MLAISSSCTPSDAFSFFPPPHFKPRLIFIVMKCHCDDAGAYNSVASGSHFVHSESEQEAGLVGALREVKMGWLFAEIDSLKVPQ